MGKRLSISQPTNIQTELTPFDESFYLETSGSLEQWYYANTNIYSPNREIERLTITPKLSVYDPDTNTSYVPNFIVAWAALYWNGSEWHEESITETSDSPTNPYVKHGSELWVHKNNSDAVHGITIKCSLTYTDPRDIGTSYTIYSQVVLTTNKDASVVYPDLNEMGEASRSFNPLRDENAEFKFKAQADWSRVTDINRALLEYKVDTLGTEQITPANDNALLTCSPIMDIRYGSRLLENQQFMFRQVSGGTVESIENETATITKVLGNAVKINQLVQSLNEASETLGITRTINGNALHYSGTSQSSTSFTGTSQISFIGGHKYYVSAKGMPLTCGIIDSSMIGHDADILSPSSNTNTGIAIYIPSGVSIENDVYFRCIDLTSAGIDSLTTVEQVEAYLAKSVGLNDYYPYTQGTLLPMKMTSIKSVGFNQWDEEWELGTWDSDSGQKEPATNLIRCANHISVLPNTTYYFKCPTNNNRVLFYDEYKNLISSDTTIYNSTFTTPSNCKYLTFVIYASVYDDNICINISDSTKNGQYEAYKGNVAEFDVTKITGVPVGGVSRVQCFPNGMLKADDAGTIHDMLYISDGQLLAKRMTLAVDLGSLEWETSNDNAFYSSIPNENASLNALNTICARYEVRVGSYNMSYDKTIGRSNQSPYNNIIFCRDDSFNKVTTDFKNAMNGVLLAYELATPVIYEQLQYDGKPFPQMGTFEWYTIMNGSEVLIENHPAYKMASQDIGKGQHTDTITLNAFYSENMKVILRMKKFTSDTTLFPMRVYRNITWKIAHIDSIVNCENGSAARESSKEFVFSNIVNIKDSNLSDDKIFSNLRFNWKYRTIDAGTKPPKDYGWGAKTTMYKKQVFSTNKKSTNVYNEVYLLGAYDSVLYNGDEVTYNGESLYVRPLETT